MSLRIVNLKVLKKLAVFPILEDITGCEVPDPRDCGTGSGSGECEAIPCDEECIETCQQCDTMSGVWELTIEGIADHIQLCHIAQPNDGNYCRFISQDLEWELYYSAVDTLWILVNYQTDAFYYIEGLDWICTSANALTDLDGGPTAIVDPANGCEDISTDCSDLPVSPILYMVITGASAESCCPGIDTITLTYLADGNVAMWGILNGPGWYSPVYSCTGVDGQWRVFCNHEDPSKFALQLACPALTGFSGADLVFTPDPFNLVFTNFNGGDSSCCPVGVSAGLTFTITDVSP